MVTLIDNTKQRNKTSTKSQQLRHPEKRNNPVSTPLRKPDWIRVKAPGSKDYQTTGKVMSGCSKEVTGQ